MSVAVRSLFLRMAREFSVSDTSEKFIDAFVCAYNDTALDLENNSFVSIDEITNLSGNISCDDKYRGVIIMGLRYYLTLTAQWGKQMTNELLGAWIDARSMAQSMYFEDNPPDVVWAVDDDGNPA